MVTKNDMVTNKIYSFSIKNWETEICGIVLETSDDWVLTKPINDYFVDGYTLINTKYIKNWINSEDDNFVERVLRANKRWDATVKISIPLFTKDLFSYLDKNQILFQMSFRDDTYVFLGQIKSLATKSFQLRLLNSKGEWLSETKLVSIDKVATIELDTIYINSLLNYNKSILDQ